jgi:chromosome segregation ATPase
MGQPSWQPDATPVAAAQVFGKTLVCRNLDVAARVARETDLNCVTMEGDQARSAGCCSTLCTTNPAWQGAGLAGMCWGAAP